ncbi:MAG: energy-coupling factor ABC transporter permease [Victivallaceae bacterium]|nr:energy-coupling factor ABC transporter permease [Victivallaceae bacterium]
MHMADALLSPAVGGVMWMISGGTVAYSVREVRKNFSEKRIPLMGVSGAFVFAAQMVNFAIPGTGSSGHIAGGVLLAALLGPAPGFLTMASVLLIQALFFADGGLLALGGNLFNMGFAGCFFAYLLLFRPLLVGAKEPSRARIVIASVAACVGSMEFGAFCVTIETLLSGVTSLPFGAFVAAMLPIHLAIGIGEGLATGAVLCFVRRNLPRYEASRLERSEHRGTELVLTFAVAALVAAGGLSLLASSRPDGLEWSIGKVAEGGEIAAGESAIHAFWERCATFFAVLPDYAIPGRDCWWGSAFAGIVGASICALFTVVAAWVLIRRRRHRQVDSQI